MSDPKKHHYVPQCYLKRFSSDKLNIKYFNKVSKEHRFEKINEAFQLENLYLLSQHKDPYFIEKTFFSNNIENKLGDLLKFFEELNTNSCKINFNKDRRVKLSTQIVLQYMRTPFYRDIKSQNELEIYYDQIKQILSRFNYEVEEIGFIPNNKAEFHKTILLEEKSKIISSIAEVQWELLYINSGEFYSSDNPVSIISKEDKNVKYCDAIMDFSDIYYPLNPNLMLHITNAPCNSFKNIPLNLITESKKDEINSIIIKNAVEGIIYKNEFK